MIKKHYSLVSLNELSDFIGLGVRTIKTRWIPNQKKIKQYNAIQVLSFLDKEGIDENTLFKMVKSHNAIVKDLEIQKKMAEDLIKKGLNNA